MEMYNSCFSTSGFHFLTSSGRGKTDTCQDSMDWKASSMFYNAHDLSGHLTQVKSLLITEEPGPSGSLGKHPILINQGARGATHGQGQHLLLGAQPPGQSTRKWEGFEDCVGISQAG